MRTILWPNINYITMFKTFVTNTKSRRNIYLFRNKHSKTRNAVSYHGGLSSTLWTYLMSQSLWHESEAHSMQLPHDKQWVLFNEFLLALGNWSRTYSLWGCSYAPQRSIVGQSFVFSTYHTALANIQLFKNITRSYWVVRSCNNAYCSILEFLQLICSHFWAIT